MSFYTMLAGRVIFGCGAETLWVVQAVYVSKWFFDQELSFAMGASGCLPNLFSSLSGVSVPWFYENYGLGTALSVGGWICLFSFILSMLMIVLDKKAKKHDSQILANV